MNDHDTLPDEEIIEDGPTREELLTRSTAPAGRKLGPLTIRPLTSETFSYLWHRKNFYIAPLMGEGATVNANPVWSAAEFVYIHTGDQDEVADCIWEERAFKDNVRALMNGALNDPSLLTASLPIIEEMVKEYFAAQNESAASKQSPQGRSASPGKKPARAGKRHT